MDSQSESRLGDSCGRWFLRGTAVGMLLMATVNAISYFFRSSDWSSLVGGPTTGRSPSQTESVGFPLKVWESGNSYGGLFADYPNLAINILVAAVVGSIIGWIAMRNTGFLNSLIYDFSNEQGAAATPHSVTPIQFSLAGLMIATTLSAVAAMLITKMAATRWTMIAIYVFGPVTLVIIAMLPRRLAWQQRVVIIIPATFAFIVVAIAVGSKLGMEFDKVLMGVFLCWTPQSASAAIGLTATILITEIRQRRRKTSSDI